MSPQPSLPTNLAWPERLSIMEEAISAFNHPIQALELGTWFGEGSTQVWLKHLPAGSSLTLVDQWRPYASAADLADPGFDYAQMDARMFEAYISTVLAVRKAEQRRNDEIDVTIIRGKSDKVLGNLRDGSFDFIYLDGDHKYAGIKRDIVEAKRLAKSDFSIICGDDLEKLPSEEWLEVARSNKDKDFIRDEHFHPGVMLAIHEEFETVNWHKGFWWIYMVNGVITDKA